jgi:hypothetical protein
MRPVAFRFQLSMGLALSHIENDFARLPSGRSLREAKVGHLKIGPLHKNLEKSGVNLVGKDKLRTMLNENFALVKRILLEYQSDYHTKSIEEADRAPVTTPQRTRSSTSPRNSGFQVSLPIRQLRVEVLNFGWWAGARDY